MKRNEYEHQPTGALHGADPDDDDARSESATERARARIVNSRGGGYYDDVTITGTTKIDGDHDDFQQSERAKILDHKESPMAQMQTYRNHVRFFAPFHFFVVPVLLINVLNAVRYVYLHPSRSTVWELIVAAALFTLAFVARTMALTVQDRLILLEMRLRMQQILPADLCARLDELTRPQLVALRFAGDHELPELVRNVLAGKLLTQKAIKERVRDWKADYLRA